MKLNTFILGLLPLLMVGCASTDKINTIADHRASIIASGLPYKIGPLNVMSAKADGHTVKIMMIYNNTGTIAPSQLIDASVKTYCNDNEVRTVLDQGVSYHLEMRNERGQMLVEKVINEATCQNQPS